MPSAPSLSASVRSNFSVAASTASLLTSRADKRWRVGGGGLEGEHGLEYRGATQRALHAQFLDEPLEGEVLVLIGLKRCLPDAGQHTREGVGVRQPGAESERVDEEANERLKLGAGAAGDGSADDDV